MASVCYTPWKVPRLRATRLGSCGQPVTGSCVTVVTDSIISVEMTKEYEDRQEFFVKNGDGVFCVKETNAPILKWINLTLTFCNVDPELVNIMSAEQLVPNDAVSPVNTGYSTDEGSAASANFALETWTRVANATGVPCTGSEFGYMLFPWVVEGTVGDLTYENGTVSFVLNARTRSNSLWGTGVYFVDYSDNPAGSTTNIALLTAIRSTEHQRTFLSRKPLPAASCGCQPLFTTTPTGPLP